MTRIDFHGPGFATNGKSKCMLSIAKLIPFEIQRSAVCAKDTDIYIILHAGYRVIAALCIGPGFGDG